MEIRRINNGKIFYFGNEVIPKYSFNAKELDEETGMYYFEARYYRAPTFTSRDPLFEKYFWMSPYAYCANNPVKYVDPTGRIVEPAGEEEAKAYNELKANAPDHVRAELTRLEGAEEVFRIRMGDNVTCTDGDGNFGYNTTTLRWLVCHYILFVGIKVVLLLLIHTNFLQHL